MLDFNFIRPFWLLGFIPVIVLFYFLYNSKFKAYHWKKHCDEHLLKYVVKVEKNTKENKIYLYGLLALWSLTILILSGPSFSKINQPIYKPSYARVIVLDLSTEMLADDLKPSRLEVAKIKLHEILKESESVSNGLVLFANQGFHAIPITSDISTISVLIKNLHPRIMPENGYRPDLGVKKAVELLEQSNVDKGDIILLTSGDIAPYKEEILEASKNYKLSAIGIGTKDGAPKRGLDNKFIYKNGMIEMAKLNETELYSLTKKLSGSYKTVISALSDISAITKLPNSFSTTEEKEQLVIFKWQDYGPYLILSILPLLALGFRRGVLLCLVLSVAPKELQAMTWDDLWLNENQQGQKLFEQQEYDKAGEKFQDTNWKAYSYYKGKDYDKAIQYYEKEQKTEEDKFNLATSYAKAQKYKKSMKIYEEIIAQNPDNNKAIHNKDIVKKLMELEQKKDCDCNNKKESEDGDKEESKEDKSSKNEKQDNEQQSDEKEQKEQNQEQQNQDQAQSEQNNQQKDEQHQEASNQGQSENSENEVAENKEQELAKSEDKTSEEEPKQLGAYEEKVLNSIMDDPSYLLKAKLYKQYQQEGSK